MTRPIFIAVIFILFIGNTALTQTMEYLPCYVITLQNDTVHGTGNVSYDQRYCTFKRTDGPEYKNYSPAEMNSFRIKDGKNFISREIITDGEMTWFFLEYLVDGEIDLFYINHGGRFFIEKKNAEIIELDDDIREIKEIDGGKYMIQDKRYLGYIRAYMSEAPQLYSEIDKMSKLDQRHLVKLSVDYHNAVCNEYECVNYTKKVGNVTYKTELVAGITYHDKFYAPMTGVLLHVMDPLVNKRLYLKIGVLYSDKMAVRKDYRERNDIAYSFKFPVSFQYVFGDNKFKPTFALGWPTGIFLVSSLQGGFIYSLSPKLELSANASIDGVLRMIAEEQEWYFKNKFPHTINCGLIYRIQ